MKRTFTMMAAVVAATLAAPTAMAQGAPSARTKLVELLETRVTPSETDASRISTDLVTALSADVAAIKAVQRDDCKFGLPQQTGVFTDATKACVQRYADGVAASRRATVAEASASGCEEELEGCSADREALKVRVAALEASSGAAGGGGTGSPTPAGGLCATLDMSELQSHCVEGQMARCENGASSPLGFHVECVDPQYDGLLTVARLNTEGTGGEFDLTLQPPSGYKELGGERKPVPLPPPGTCDGAGGAFLCYIAAPAAIITAGLLVADYASDDFNLVEVRR